MNREIKFRAWDKRKKEMLIFDLVEVGEYIGFEYNIPKNVFILDAYSNGEAELMQFTGLKDKNGKEIYEGDILNCHWDIDEGQIGEIVTYITKPEGHGATVGCFGLVDKDGDFRTIDNGNIHFSYIVQGNIYENPELLK